MIRCPGCGTEWPDDRHACTLCGSSLPGSIASAEAPQASTPRSRKRLIVAVAVGLAGALAVVVIVLAFILPTHDSAATDVFEGTWKGPDGMFVLDKQGSTFVVQQLVDTANEHSSFKLPAKATLENGHLVLDWSAALPAAWAAIAKKMTVTLEADDDHIVVGWTGGPVQSGSQERHYTRVSGQPTDLPQIQGPSETALPGGEAFIGTWERNDGKGTGTVSVKSDGANVFIVQSKLADSGGSSGDGQNVLHGFARDGHVVLAEDTLATDGPDYDGDLLSLNSDGELVFVNFGVTRRFKKISDTPAQLLQE